MNNEAVRGKNECKKNLLSFADEEDEEDEDDFPKMGLISIPRSTI